MNNLGDKIKTNNMKHKSNTYKTLVIPTCFESGMYFSSIIIFRCKCNKYTPSNFYNFV